MPKQKLLFSLFILIALLFSIVSCFRSNTPVQNNNNTQNPPAQIPQATNGLLTTLLPSSYITTSGGDEAQPVSNLHVKDQLGDDNDYYRYLEFQTLNGNNYAGYRTFSLPSHITPTEITALSLTVNFLGPAPDEQEWSWQVYNWNSSSWANLGNNTGASWETGWKEFTFNITGAFTNYVGGTNNDEIRIQLASSNAVDNADVDYEAITVTGGIAPTEVTLNPISYTTTSGDDDGQPVSNLYVQDQSTDQNEWQRYVEFKTPDSNNYAGYRSYILPDYFEVNKLASIQLKANFLGPAPSPAEQTWTWSIYNWTTSTWVALGDNTGAGWETGWKEFGYDATGTLADYVDSNKEIRIQIASDNAIDDVDVDYEALVVTQNTNINDLEQYIDPEIQGEEREVMLKLLSVLLPEHRESVIYTRKDGTVYINRIHLRRDSYWDPLAVSPPGSSTPELTPSSGNFILNRHTGKPTTLATSTINVQDATNVDHWLDCPLEGENGLTSDGSGGPYFQAVMKTANQLAEEGILISEDGITPAIKYMKMDVKLPPEENIQLNGQEIAIGPKGSTVSGQQAEYPDLYPGFWGQGPYGKKIEGGLQYNLPYIVPQNKEVWVEGDKNNVVQESQGWAALSFSETQGIGGSASRILGPQDVTIELFITEGDGIYTGNVDNRFILNISDVDINHLDAGCSGNGTCNATLYPQSSITYAWDDLETFNPSGAGDFTPVVSVSIAQLPENLQTGSIMKGFEVSNIKVAACKDESKCSQISWDPLAEGNPLNQAPPCTAGGTSIPVDISGEDGTIKIDFDLRPDIGPARSKGEPHITTYDQKGYDFQAIGDYVLSRSTIPNDDFEVQVRYIARVQGSTSEDRISVAGATAMMINGEHLEFYAIPGGTIAAYANGQELTSFPTRFSEVTINKSWLFGDLFEITTTDRKFIKIRGWIPREPPLTPIISDINILLPSKYYDSLEGLSGNGNNDPTDDLFIRNGVVLANPTPEQLYFGSGIKSYFAGLGGNTYRDSWSLFYGVSQSLFTQGTDPFSRTYPRSFVNLGDFNAQEITEAKAVCEAAGITDTWSLRSCTFDLVLTQDIGWTNIYKDLDFSNNLIVITPNLQVTDSGLPNTLNFNSSTNLPISSEDLAWKLYGHDLDTFALDVSGTTAQFTTTGQKGEYTLTASLMSDPSQIAIATVIVADPLVVHPTEAIVLVGESKDFEASIDDGLSIGWSTQYGSIALNGLSVTYTAPSTPVSDTLMAFVQEDTSKQSSVPITVINDRLTPSIIVIDPNQTVSLTWEGADSLPVIWTASGGTITSEGTYSASTGTYTINANLANDTNVHVSTIAYVGTNPPPVAENDFYNVNLYSCCTISLFVLANDSDVNGGTLTITSISTPSLGVASISSNGTVIQYDFSDVSSGPDNFTYTISDGQGGSATANITVNFYSPSL